MVMVMVVMVVMVVEVDGDGDGNGRWWWWWRIHNTLLHWKQTLYPLDFPAGCTLI